MEFDCLPVVRKCVQFIFRLAFTNNFYQDNYDYFEEEFLITEERKQHLELVAASLTQAYYTEHTAASRDYRELLDTFTYILDALIEKDKLPYRESPLTASDSLVNPETDDSRS